MIKSKKEVIGNVQEGKTDFMESTFPIRIRDSGTSLLITIPSHIVKKGFKTGDYVKVTIEHLPITEREDSSHLPPNELIPSSGSDKKTGDLHEGKQVR